MQAIGNSYQTLTSVNLTCRYSHMHKLACFLLDDLCSIFDAVLMLPWWVITESRFEFYIRKMITHQGSISTAWKTLHKSSSRNYTHFMHTRVPTNKARWFQCLVIHIASYALHLLYFFLQAMFPTSNLSYVTHWTN